MKRFYNFSKCLLTILTVWASVLALQAEGANGLSKVVSGKTAMEITAELMPGWNLGNTFDATGGKGLSSETSWGAPRTTREMIHAVKQAGFKSIRIPVSWGTHTTAADGFSYKIDDAWLNRVKEVVEWSIDEDLYVIVNIHHDNSKTLWYPSKTYKERSVTYVTDIWTQLAETFAEFDQRLIFEVLNEPRLVGSTVEWWFDDNNKSIVVKDAISIINECNQIGVDITRANGKGHNSERLVMCPGYAAARCGALSVDYKLPEDDMVAVSVHAYEPNSLCLAGTKKTFNDSDDALILNEVMMPLYNKFVSKGIPVILGEASCSNKANLDARVAWVESYYGYAKKFGMPVILWDNHEIGTSGGENHGYLNRVDLTWTWPEMNDAIMRIVDSLELVEADIVKMYYADKTLILKSDSEIKSCKIYAVSGILVDDFEVNANYFSKSLNLVNGAYLVTFETAEGLSAKKLLVY